MKKKMLLSLSMLLFVSMMAFNLYVGSAQKTSEISRVALADLIMMPMIGQAEDGNENGADCSNADNCEYHKVTGNDPLGNPVCCHSDSSHSTGNKEWSI